MAADVNLLETVMFVNMVSICVKYMFTTCSNLIVKLNGFVRE